MNVVENDIVFVWVVNALAILLVAILLGILSVVSPPFDSGSLLRLPKRYLSGRWRAQYRLFYDMQGVIHVIGRGTRKSSLDTGPPILQCIG